MSVYRAAGGRRVALRGPPIGPEQAVEFKGDERLARGRRWREVAGCTAFEAMLASDAAATSPVITTARAQASWPSPHRVPHLASKRHWLTFRSEGYFATVDRLTRSTRDLLNTLATITIPRRRVGRHNDSARAFDAHRARGVRARVDPRPAPATLRRIHATHRGPMQLWPLRRLPISEWDF